MSNSWRQLGRRYHIPVTSTASVRLVFLHLPHKKKHGALHCLTCLEGGRLLDLLRGVGQPRFLEADKAINRRGDDSGGDGMEDEWEQKGEKKDSPLRISGSEQELRRSVNGQKLRHCNLSLTTHTDTQICLSALPFGCGSCLPVWVLLAPHSPWRPDVQLDHTLHSSTQAATEELELGGGKKTKGLIPPIPP